MPITYQPPGYNKAFYISPAPFVDISKEYQKMNNGEIIGVQYSITLNGTLVADRGSPRHTPFAGAPVDFDADQDITDLDGPDGVPPTSDRRWGSPADNVVPANGLGLPGLDFVDSINVAGGVDPDAAEPIAIFS